MSDAIERLRTSTESELTSLLTGLNERRRGELLKAIDAYGSVRGIPYAFWDRWRDETREDAASLVLLLMMGTYTAERESVARTLPREARETLPPIDPQRLETQARLPSLFLADEIIDAHVNGLRDRLGRNIDDNAAELNARPASEARAQVVQVVDEALDKTATEGNVVTNVTRGVSAGQGSAAGDVSNATGLVIDQAWATERDSRVCPICQPLDRKPSIEWQDRFPEGPPAHPRCRCRLVNFYRGRGAQSN